MKPPPCPYCGAEPVLREAEEIYGTPYGRVWVCANYPACDSLVGCHRHTSNAFGPLANKELRTLRHKAHVVFDGWWTRNRIRRNEAYIALQRVMHVPAKSCHIGYFDEGQCKRVIAEFSPNSENAIYSAREDKDKNGQTN